MLVTMKNSGLIDQLVLIAGGDAGLVYEAIDFSVKGTDGEADLKEVVDYILRHQSREPVAA